MYSTHSAIKSPVSGHKSPSIRKSRSGRPEGGRFTSDAETERLLFGLCNVRKGPENKREASTEATTLHVVLVTAAGFLVEDDAVLTRQQQDTELTIRWTLRTGCGNKPSARC
ncbi:hypothetical protein FPOAC1_008620 [Fusarium poae]|uniref:hypothetical protein n=1 Tax=Fusarium poae TaxID=36050 RepID=UPI001CE8EC92|nr:hypothetical protein FPOAC1_008620 [Fusarium poae]KAG8669232.1 hypothetical protein FPOAC1_008620 [Fusarium poae]